jgi:phenolic acid decarboxylase
MPIRFLMQFEIEFGLCTLIQKSHIHLHSLIFSSKILGERNEKYIIIYRNDKIDLKNKLNVSEYKIFKFRNVKLKKPI